MHVLFLNQYALPAGSAGITRHADIGAELVKRGHRVTIVASDYDYLHRRPGGRQRRSELMDDGVRFIWLQTGTYAGNDSSRVRSMARYTWKAFWAAIRLKPRPDVIVASSPHPLVGISGAVAAACLRIPWIFEARDFWPSALVDLGAIKRGGLTHRALLALERLCYRWSARVVVVPPRGHLRLEELGLDPGKARHVPNGTEPRQSPGILPDELQGMFGQLAGSFVITYTGALGVPQSFESALDGMAHLSQDEPGASANVALLLIGGGVRRTALMDHARELGLANVLFHGPVEKAAVAAALARSDACLVQLGRLDTFRYGLSPNKLFDYFGRGKPVLIAAEYPTVVDEARAGIRFQPGDPDAFADAVLQLMRTPEVEREAMGARGRKMVATRYSIPAIAEVYEGVLREVVAPGPA